MANLSSGSFDLFIDSLVSAMESIQQHDDRNRMAFILRELCTRLSGEILFCSLSENISSREPSQKTVSIVQLLNLLVTTSHQLYPLRQSLIGSDEESKIFSTLWSCWVRCPVSSLSLALLGKRYAL